MATKKRQGEKPLNKLEAAICKAEWVINSASLDINNLYTQKNKEQLTQSNEFLIKLSNEDVIKRKEAEFKAPWSNLIDE